MAQVNFSNSKQSEVKSRISIEVTEIKPSFNHSSSSLDRNYDSDGGD